MTLNNEMILTCPEGFHVMDGEELSRLNFLKKGDGECLSDPDRHIIISIGWRKAKGFSHFRVKAEEIAHHDEKLIARSMKDLSYCLDDFRTGEIGGEKFGGFRYTYVAQSIGMIAESIVLKHNKTFYYLHIYTREALKTENLRLWEEMLQGIRFA